MAYEGAMTVYDLLLQPIVAIDGTFKCVSCPSFYFVAEYPKFNYMVVASHLILLKCT